MPKSTAEQYLTQLIHTARHGLEAAREAVNDSERAVRVAESATVTAKQALEAAQISHDALVGLAGRIKNAVDAPIRAKRGRPRTRLIGGHAVYFSPQGMLRKGM